jgi:F-type H+-transporting ATPase subunit delta
VRPTAEGGRTPAVKAQPRSLARRWARALFDVAAAQPAEPARLGNELEEFLRRLTTHSELSHSLADPRLRPEARRGLVLAVARQAGGSELLLRLLGLLALRDRLALLPALAGAYRERLNEQAGTLPAEAVSAVPLAAAQRQALEQALGAALGRAVTIDARVEPELLGGVLVRVGGRSFDGSVRGQLASLRRRLAVDS